MNRNLIIALLVLGFFLLVYLLASSERDRFSWYPEYTDGKNSPYNSGVLLDVLGRERQLKRVDDKRIYQALPKPQGLGSQAYVFMGNSLVYNEQETEYLLEYVRQGGEAMLITDYWPDSLLFKLFAFEDCGRFSTSFTNSVNWQGGSRYLSVSLAEQVQARFTHPKLADKTYQFKYNQGDNFQSQASWLYLDPLFICDRNQYPTAVLGEVELSTTLAPREQEWGRWDEDGNWIEPDIEPIEQENEARTKLQSRWLPNFIRLKIGEGYLFLHSNPLMLSNYYLTSEQGQAYAEGIFRHLRSKTVYWDAASRRPDLARRVPPPPVRHRTPLEYIFSQAALRQAWYLILAAAGLFVLFRAKRRQRIIPVLPENRNTSLEFVQTIGRLYFLEQNHRLVFERLMQFYLSHLRQRYQLVTRELNEDLQRRIVLRSGVDARIVEDIFSTYNRVKQALHDPHVLVSTRTLNEFYSKIQAFHRAVAEQKGQFSPRRSKPA